MSDDLDKAFRALADPSRRLLLDALRERDGQSIAELSEPFAIGRFGVAKHLGILEEASLVVSRRDGRRKLHYLNPMPIQLIADRWISEYAKRWTGALADLKYHLEHPMNEHRHLYETYIRATAEAIYDALTSEIESPKYWYGMTLRSTWEPGAPWASIDLTDGSEQISGTVMEAVRPHRLVTTFGMKWAATDESPSQVTWEIEDLGGMCKVTLIHDGFDGETETFRQVGPGWNIILSGLKTLLETGEPLSGEHGPAADVVSS